MAQPQRRRRRRDEESDFADPDAPTAPSYLAESARLLETTLAEFTTRGREPPPASLKRILDLASHLFQTGVRVCSHSCDHHAKLMDPILWGTLPPKLLPQIFLKLPLPKLITLQSLSRRWKAAFSPNPDSDPSTSAFLTACDASHPVFAILTPAPPQSNKFLVRLLDVNLHTWHHYELHAGDARALHVTAASHDGGLVCFVSSLKKKQHPHNTRTFLVDVVNPLNQTACALPPLQNLLLVEMAHIAVHPETKHYVVLVVGEAAAGTRVTKVYDPKRSVDKWVAPTKQRAAYYGYRFRLGNFRYHQQRRDCPSVYDRAGRLLYNLRDRKNPMEKEGVKSLAMAGDRVFVLYKDRKIPLREEEERRWDRAARLHIVEYQLAFGAKEEWKKRKSIRCEPFEVPPNAKYEFSLFACQGFLVVWAVLAAEAEPLRKEVGWVYDREACRWKELPELPGGVPVQGDDLMCRMHWNVSV